MIGPVQLLVVGFDQPDFQGEVLAHLESLREHDVARVIDVLVVNKDADGVVTTAQISDLSEEEAQELGAVVKALVGLGEMAGGDAEGAARLWSQEGSGLGEEDLLDVLEEIRPTRRWRSRCSSTDWAIPCARRSCAPEASRSSTRGCTPAT